MKQYASLLALILFLATPAAYGKAPDAFISDTKPYQGDTFVVRFSGSAEPISGSLGSAELVFFPYRTSYMAVLPIPAAENPGARSLTVRFKDGERFTRTITVRKRNFVTVDLGIPKELGLTTNQLITKLGDEKVNIENTVRERTNQVFFEKAFGLPLADNRTVTSPYGEIRKTGDSVIRHWGIDLKAREGAAVGAISGGVVKRAYYDTVYGNTIIIDHGEGIYSLSMHMKEMRKKEGDRVERGTVIGLVGNTGYSTSAHLHLSIKVNSVSVDPVRFMNGFR